MPSPTRGFGLLESLLARLRGCMADKLIPPYLRNGRILDIGCGNYPAFLKSTNFSEKYGLDKIASAQFIPEIIIVNHDIESSPTLPFADDHFKVVTMLAVCEHLEKYKFAEITKEVHRILKKNGLFVITTPAHWTEGLLRAMSSIRLISIDEIAEHKNSFDHGALRNVMIEAGFDIARIKFGYFELFMNIWATAEK